MVSNDEILGDLERMLVGVDGTEELVNEGKEYELFEKEEEDDGRGWCTGGRSPTKDSLNLELAEIWGEAGTEDALDELDEAEALVIAVHNGETGRRRRRGNVCTE
jgi:hypothetical protein